MRKKLTQALLQRKGQIGYCEGTGGRLHKPACAELLIEAHQVGVAAKRLGVERERLVCFSFASVFFCTSKENAQKRTIDIFILNCRILNIKYKVVGAIHKSHAKLAQWKKLSF